jgi:hypothetical protein
MPPAAARARRPERAVNSSTVVIGLFILATLAMLAGLGGRAANIAYTGLAVVAGVLLIQRSPATYSSFSLWLWFVTPFVRRMLDYRHGWHPTNPALLAPPLVAALSIVTVWRHGRELRGRLFAPYLLILGALAYGYMVGLMVAGFIPATYALLTWIAPITFGVHLALSWRHYVELRASIRRTFAVALPMLGLYGVYQFVRIPPWDAAWMINADLRSVGSPLPYLVRVFGTLNTPGPYAAFLLVGILLVLAGTGFKRFPGIAVALIALLLTRTRSSWVAFVIGLVLMQVSQPVIRLPRRIIALVLVAVLAAPFTAIPKFRSTVLTRMSTLKDIRSDNSFIKRVEFSQEAATGIVESALGNGLGTTGGAVKLENRAVGVRSLDNGFLELFYVFGWPGGAMFLLGIGTLLIQTIRFAEARRDPFAGAVRATAMAILAIMPIGDIFSGSTGTLLWAMIGLGIAAHAYHLTTGLALRSRAAPRFRPGVLVPQWAAPVTAVVPARPAP